MGRSFALVRIVSVFIVLGSIVTLSGCSSGSPTNATSFPVPASIGLAPANSVSLDTGSTTQTFTASPRNTANAAVTTPVTFLSSNTAVLTVASNGNACAGTWDSLTTPQICTPGPVGVAQVTATASGVSSPPTTVYVHQHVDKIVVSAIPGQTPPLGTCFSKGQLFNYQATALSRGLDITASVGPFAWQVIPSDVATVTAVTESTPVSGLLIGQAQVLAHTPGVSSLFASASNVNSQPQDFTTCAVQSITLAVTGSNSNSLNVTSGTGRTVTATVLDTQGNTITEIPLTWSSSNPSTVGVSSAGSVTTSKAGGSSVIASCTPPICNIGIKPLLPIYPEGVVDLVVTSSTTTTTNTETIYVSSTGVSASGNCATTDGCVSSLIPITTPNNTVGTAVGLPATPNSLVFDRQGAKAYMGTDFGFLGTRGLMEITVATPPTVSEFKSVTGKVLTVSPDGRKVIVSDTVSTPNQVFVFDTTTSTSVILPIAGATAADYSPDNLKAYILAGSTLYVYSTLEALKSVALAAPAVDISFLANGAFAYLAGGTPSGVAVHTTCTNAQATTVSTPATPTFIKTLPNAGQVLAVDSPGVDVVSVNTTPVGCSPPVSNTVQSFNLGQGNFVPRQFIVSQDGTRAYILAANLGSVLVFNVGNQTSSAIPLSGDAVPIQASLTADGNLLYIAAADGQVHILDTQSGGDIQQISFPPNTTTLQNGLCSGTAFACNPDLIAVKP
jgi:trimeric autotransporter adhesin